jgi:small subunit ribosomal protein S6
MRRYETILILDPDLSEEGRQPMLDRIVEAIIPEQGGELIASDEWGNRKLAYEIKKRIRGYYVYLDYCGTGSVVDEIERFCRIEDGVLKYMTMVTDKDFDPEALKAAEETEAAEEEDDSSAAEPEPPAQDTAAPEPADESETETEKENQ